MPRTLSLMRERYWWPYNTSFKNPFSGALVRETSFLEPSAGDITLAFKIWQNDLELIVMGYGEKGQRLPPYHDERESGAAWSNLAMLDYARGLEGRSMYIVWRESKPVGTAYGLTEWTAPDRTTSLRLRCLVTPRANFHTSLPDQDNPVLDEPVRRHGA